MAVLGLRFCARAFSSCGKRGPLFIAVRGPLTIVASRCWAQAPDAQAQQLWLTGPAAPRHVGSSQTRARTHVPCTGRQTPNHCATREAPMCLLFNPWIILKFILNVWVLEKYFLADCSKFYCNVITEYDQSYIVVPLFYWGLICCLKRNACSKLQTNIPMNIAAKTLSKVPAKWIQQYIKMILYDHFIRISLNQ